MIKRSKFKSYLILIFIFQLTNLNAQKNLKGLEQELLRLGALSGGKMGIGVIHLETDQRLYINNKERYPLASTYKVPIAVQLLKRVENGEITLNDMTDVQPKDQHPGSGILSDLLVAPGVKLSLRNQLELMMIISDNSATDICLSAAGGSKKIKRLLKKHKIRDMSIDRPTIGIIGDWLGIKLEGGANSNQAMNEKYNALSKEEKREVEPWVQSAVAYLHHPLRSKEAEKYIRPSLELLEEIQRTGDIFFPARFINATLSGHQSASARKIVNQFLDDYPNYSPPLKLKILQAADNLFRASIITEQDN